MPADTSLLEACEFTTEKINIMTPTFDPSSDECSQSFDIRFTYVLSDFATLAGLVV